MKLFDIGGRGDPSLQKVHRRVWTVANAISFARLAGLPLFVWLMLGPRRYGAAFAVLVVIASTDWIDGYVARRFDQVSRLGQVMDPLIDRALLATVTITLLVVGLLPWPVLALIVGRDVVLLGAAFLLFGGLPAAIPVSRTGKFATACFLVGIPGLLLASLEWPFADVVGVLAWVCIGAGLVGYYVGAVQYARVAIRLKRMG